MRSQIRIRYGALLAATVLAAQSLPVYADNFSDIFTSAQAHKLKLSDQSLQSSHALPLLADLPGLPQPPGVPQPPGLPQPPTLPPLPVLQPPRGLPLLPGGIYPFPGMRVGLQNGLPPTSLDSFVLNAGGSAEAIYGDEGVDGPPPYNEFTVEHRIDTGIQGQRSAGLTTGHGSIMPDAWGNDEFLGQEWCNTNRGRPPMLMGGQFINPAALAQTAITAGAGLAAGAIQNGATAPPQIPTDPNAGLPPPPGPGFQPAYVHGQFVGYYSPDEVALAQTDFPRAFQAFVNSGRYIGDPANAQFILQNEMGLTP